MEILWLCILVALCVIMGVLLIGGGIALYLAPRMTGIVWFGFVVLALLSIYQVSRVLKSIRERNRSVRLYGLVFLLPLVLMLTCPPVADTPQTLPNTGYALQQSAPTASPDTGQQLPAQSPSASEMPQPSPAEPTQEQTPAVRSTAANGLAPSVFSKELVELDADADRFHEYIYKSNEELLGQKITLYGFVQKDSAFPEGTILIGRLYISCCVADASLLGYHIRVENEDDYQDGEWICATGTVALVPIEFYGDYYDFPILTDGTVSRCITPPLDNAYIYP